jgi:hypothetical protein
VDIFEIREQIWNQGLTGIKISIFMFKTNFSPYLVGRFWRKEYGKFLLFMPEPDASPRGKVVSRCGWESISEVKFGLRQLLDKKQSYTYDYIGKRAENYRYFFGDIWTSSSQDTESDEVTDIENGTHVRKSGTAHWNLIGASKSSIEDPRKS